MSYYHQPLNKRELLARTIAETFQDEARLQHYLVFCRKYPLTILLKAFAHAKHYPQANIKKSRAAIFFYLVKRYAHQAPRHLSH